MSSFTHSGSHRPNSQSRRRSASVVALNRDIEAMEAEDTLATARDAQASLVPASREERVEPRDEVRPAQDNDALSTVMAEISTLSSELQQLFNQQSTLQKNQTKSYDKATSRSEKLLTRQKDESKFARKMLGRLSKYLDALRREQSERGAEYKELREAHNDSLRDHARDLKRLNESFEDQKRKMNAQLVEARGQAAKANDAKHEAQRERNSALRLVERVTDKVGALETEMAKEIVPLRELVDTYREREKILMEQLEEARKDVKSLQILKRG